MALKYILYVFSSKKTVNIHTFHRSSTRAFKKLKSTICLSQASIIYALAHALTLVFLFTNYKNPKLFYF